ncbi:MAG: hypothetical protein EON58_17660, partial [Alphaproteobacteria bacterium]
MKVLFNLFSIASLACMASLALGHIDLTTTSNGRARPEVKPTVRTEAVPQGTHARSKVVQYFSTYQMDPLGLPPDCLSGMGENQFLQQWETVGFGPGVVIPEADRDALIGIPAELLNVLPISDEGIRYYLAGNQVVAVDSGFKVVDAIPIPTVRL